MAFTSAAFSADSPRRRRSADGVAVGGRAGYIGRTLARYRHRLVAAPGDVAGIVLEQPQDLRRLDCACWRSAAQPVWQLGDTALVVEPVVATNDSQHLLHLALGGHVVTELPPFLAPAPLSRGQLVEGLPEHPLPRQTVRALVAETRLLSPLVRHFLDFVAEVVPPTLDPYVGG